MKRRVFSLVIAVLMLASICCVCFADGYAFAIDGKIDVQGASKGESFTLTAYVNEISSDKGIITLDAVIKYDPSMIKLVKYEGIYPSDWDGFSIHAPEVTSGNVTEIRLVMFHDGMNINESISVYDDDTFGFKLEFNVLTSNETTTTISIPEGNTLTATTGFPELSSVAGTGKNFSVKLNDKSESNGEVVSSDSSTESVVSEEETTSADISVEEPSSGAESAEDLSNVEGSVAESEDVTEESVDLSTESVESTENISDNSIPNSGEQSESNDEDEGGLGFVLWIVIACVIVAVVAFVTYFLKNKKDDMNPVNPG